MSTKRASTKTTTSARVKGEPSAVWPSPATLALLSHLDAAALARLVSGAADIVLLLDENGLVCDAAAQPDSVPPAVLRTWVGQSLDSLVTEDSRVKVVALRDGDSPLRWRHVNHRLPDGVVWPVQYVPQGVPGSAFRLLFGRDMRSLGVLQQRLVEAQNQLEADYVRVRHAEARATVLFETDAEGILVIDAATARVLEANAAARSLLDLPARRLVGQVFGAGFTERARRELNALMGRVRNSGRSEDIQVRLGPPARRELRATASLLMLEQQARLLLRLQPTVADAEVGARAVLAQALGQAPDGIVLTDSDGRVLQANAAFVEFTQLASEAQVQGESIGRWLGRGTVDLNVMLAALRQQGVLRLFATVVNGEHGGETEVEVSGAASGDEEAPGLAFVVRHVGRRLNNDKALPVEGPRSVEQLTQLVGRMPLKDLVRESSDLIEQLCIEAALTLTQGNRAAAAEMLGLSRQSLYVKLHRYGIGELGDARRG